MIRGKRKKALHGLTIIFKYVKPYQKVITVISVLSIVSAIANTAVPYFAGRIIDSIVSQNQTFALFGKVMPLVFLFLGIWIVIKFIADASSWQIELKQEKLLSLVEADYIVKGMSRLLELPLSFHKEHKMGDTMDRINRASSWLQNILGNVLIGLAPQILSVAGALAVTFAIKPILTSLILVAVVIYVFILFNVAPKLSALQRKMHHAYNQAYGDAYDAVMNAQAVKQATAEEYEHKKSYKNFNLKAAKFWQEFIGIWQNISFSQRVIIIVSQIIIYAYAINSIWQGRMTIGELVMFNGYAAMFFGPFVILAQNWQTFNNGLVALERAEKILTQPTEVYVPEAPVILEKLKGGVEFKNVSFTYKNNKTPTLSDVSFSVHSGEIIALVGESGVGKTTLVDLISNYIQPTAGEIYLDGHDIRNIDLKFLRTQIAVVPQEITLFNETVKQNIRYGNFSASDRKVLEAAKLAHADDFINTFPKRYNQVVGERGIKLSTGQKQRIAIARAILKDPTILILDEPTSSLDAQSEKFVMEALEKLMEGRTTFIIAHRLSTVKKADRIFFLHRGHIAEEGTHEELIRKSGGLYKKFYELQQL